MASHSWGVMLTLCLWAPVRRRALVSSCPSIFLISERSSPGLASFLALTAAFAMSWALLSRGRFALATFSLWRRDETSFAYVFLAEGLYGLGVVLIIDFLALLARSFS